MLKAFLLVALVAGAHGGLLPSLLPTEVPTISTIYTPLEVQIAVNSFLYGIKSLASNGVLIAPPGFDQAIVTPLVTLPAGVTISAGLIALPINVTCGQPRYSIIDKLSCLIGAQDCTYVHNKYSGACGYSANPVEGTSQTFGKVFVCNDELPTATGYNITNVNDVQQCGPLLGPQLDPLVNLAINQFLRARFAGDLCTPIPDGSSLYNSAGCNSDCRNNHQYSSGVCTTGNTPLATFDTETNTDFMCICS